MAKRALLLHYFPHHMNANDIIPVVRFNDSIFSPWINNTIRNLSNHCKFVAIAIYMRVWVCVRVQIIKLWSRAMAVNASKQTSSNNACSDNDKQQLQQKKERTELNWINGSLSHNPKQWKQFISSSMLCTLRAHKANRKRSEENYCKAKKHTKQSDSHTREFLREINTNKR